MLQIFLGVYFFFITQSSTQKAISPVIFSYLSVINLPRLMYASSLVIPSTILNYACYTLQASYWARHGYPKLDHSCYFLFVFSSFRKWLDSVQPIKIKWFAHQSIWDLVITWLHALIDVNVNKVMFNFSQHTCQKYETLNTCYVSLNDIWLKVNILLDRLFVQ